MIVFYCLKKIKIASKDTDSYFRGLWWLTKQSMTLFKSQKEIKSKNIHSYLIMGLRWLIKRSIDTF